MGRIRDQRSMPIVLIVVAIALVGARIASSLMPAAAPKGELVHWVEIEDAVRMAQMSGRPLLLAFTADWSEPSHALEAELFANPELAAEINARVVAVRIVDRKREEGQNAPTVDALERRYTVQGFPTLVFVDGNGTERARMEGFRDQAEFRRVMESALR